MKQVIGVLIFLIVVFGALFLGSSYEVKESQQVYNNGICVKCGGAYKFKNADNTHKYYYACDKCDHTIRTHMLMK